MLSFNDGKDAQRGGVYFWPRVFSLDNYKIVFMNEQILVAARNTVLRTAGGIVLAVLVTAMFAYAVSRERFSLKKLYMGVVIPTMYISGGLIPYFITIRNIGLLDNFLVYLLPAAFSVFNCLLFMSFFKTLPSSLEDSAKIDGANDMYVFFRIVFPISMPVVATIALFTGVGQWNSWYDTMLFTTDSRLDTLAHVMMKIINTQRYLEENITREKSNRMMQMEGATTNALMLAVMVVTTFPIVAMYPFLQNHFVKGVMIGSIKG